MERILERYGYDTIYRRQGRKSGLYDQTTNVYAEWEDGGAHYCLAKIEMISLQNENVAFEKIGRVPNKNTLSILSIQVSESQISARVAGWHTAGKQ